MGINKWLEHVAISTSQSVELLQAESFSNSPRKLHALAKTSVPSALEKRATDMLAADSIESSPTSCVKAGTSPTTTGLVERAFTATSSRMKTLSSSTPRNTNFLWPTPDQTPMDLSSSSPPQ